MQILITLKAFFHESSDDSNLFDSGNLSGRNEGFKVQIAAVTCECRFSTFHAGSFHLKNGRLQIGCGAI